MGKGDFLTVSGRGSSEILREDFELSNLDIDKIKREERRVDWKHKTTHFFAGCIILAFLFVILYQIIIAPSEPIRVPDFFISIVSVVVGFYFAKSFYDK